MFGWPGEICIQVFHKTDAHVRVMPLQGESLRQSLFVSYHSTTAAAKETTTRYGVKLGANRASNEKYPIRIEKRTAKKES